MKWALEMLGLLLVIFALTVWTKGPEWLGTEIGKLQAAYQAQINNCN